ncbi:nuclear transport factor 2 family protein [Promicromonospora sp. MS192]|uniref:nuclear transport factor 2 family protein n=1 Tax=Promicromonospora sp. MS192 TaxID=3412684 RepID=UPI003C2BE7F4
MSTSTSERASRNDALVREFVDAFEKKDAALLGSYVTDDVVFENYGDPVIHGRADLVALWAGVFRSFAEVRFETLHQAVDGDVVLAEQVHGLGLAGRPPAPVRNLAVYEIRDGKIAAWRDCTNPVEAKRLLGL